MGLKRVNENHQFSPPQALPIIPYPDFNYIRIKVKLRVTGNDSHILRRFNKAVDWPAILSNARQKSVQQQFDG
jgi:hypothetical protein